MSWVIVSLVISIIACKQAKAVAICPVDEVFNRCGSACTPTCETPVIPCTLQCVARCECPTGKVKNADGLCVDVTSCPVIPECGPFEKFTQCGGCEPTCENPVPVICPAVCLERCECLPGFVRESNGRCVLLDECLTKVCPYGDPLPGVFCGRGPGRRDCDPGYFCRIDPADRFAFCCPEADNSSSSEESDSSSS